MRPVDGRTSCPRQGSSRVKLSHAWYQEPKGSPAEILLSQVVGRVQSVEAISYRGDREIFCE